MLGLSAQPAAVQLSRAGRGRTRDAISAAPASRGLAAPRGRRELRICNVSGLSGPVPTPRTTTASVPLDTSSIKVDLVSKMNMDYSLLQGLLASGQWEKADDETRAKLIELAGPEAVKRKWVYFSEVKDIPKEDLQTMDRLWKAYSGGKFGYTIQRDMWVGCKKRWAPFFKKIDWTYGENGTYRKWPTEFVYDVDKAAKGHLPLTNCLRGTQLFTEVLEHPAFAGENAKRDTSRTFGNDPRLNNAARVPDIYSAGLPLLLLLIGGVTLVAYLPQLLALTGQ